ncbi:MAG: hypothetical protein CL840_14990 [Crocinitomicaceae bacterium]|jgi:hypothetical protein|nr:hypothetical protein [Crocinitomicaceae bacterium]|tara:strand:+ start:138663 stop:139223 length:561 start_codon:yes stop_codon:yes gene_type:complete
MFTYLTYTLPKFLKRNNLDKRRYMIPITVGAVTFIFSLLHLLRADIAISYTLALLPALYYGYLICNLATVNYDFDIAELNLSTDAHKVLSNIAKVSNDDLVFSFLTINKETVGHLSFDEQRRILAEIKTAIALCKTDLTLRFRAGISSEKIEDENVKNFVTQLISKITIEIRFKDVETLRSKGINI